MSYLDSKRIVGTNADRVGIPAISGGWKELGRTTLGSSGDTISVSSLPDKRYYMVLADGLSVTGVVNKAMRFNNDSGSNYSRRYSQNGGSDGSSINQAHGGHTVSTDKEFFMSYISNLSSEEKLVLGQTVSPSTSGAGTAPTRMETVFKWTNTSSAINRIDEVNIGSGDYTSGSEVVVLGYDPDDTHTDNFWEELADASWSSGQTMDSGSFTSKKYLWVQYYVKSSGLCRDTIRFNNDSGNNYARRKSDDGGSDSTTTSNAEIRSHGSRYNISYGNFFVVNNSSNEKLVIGHYVGQKSTGAGAANAPSRTEAVGKWVNTSSQISSIQIYDLTTNFTGGQIKVWGAD